MNSSVYIGLAVGILFLGVDTSKAAEPSFETGSRTIVTTQFTTSGLAMLPLVAQADASFSPARNLSCSN